MWMLLAMALAVPAPQLPSGESASDWVEPWKHAGLTELLDVSVHFRPEGPDRWRLQVLRNGHVAREVSVDRPSTHGEREELAFLAAGLLRELREADQRVPAAPVPIAPPPPPRPPPVPAPRPAPMPAPVLHPMDVLLDAPMQVMLPAPTGASARLDPELQLPELDVDELAEPRLAEPEPEPGPPRKGLQLAPLTVSLGAAATPSADLAWRVGLQLPVYRGEYLTWHTDLGLLPAHDLHVESANGSVTSFQGEARFGFTVNHRWLLTGTQVGVATRGYAQDGRTIEQLLVPQVSGLTGVGVGRFHAAVELGTDLLRVDLRMPDQSIHSGGSTFGRVLIGATFGRRSDPKHRPATSPERTEEMP